MAYFLVSCYESDREEHETEEILKTPDLAYDTPDDGPVEPGRRAGGPGVVRAEGLAHEGAPRAVDRPDQGRLYRDPADGRRRATAHPRAGRGSYVWVGMEGLRD